MKKKIRSPLNQAFLDVSRELSKAVDANGPMKSAHEGYAIILEELDEVKEWVWMKPSKRKVAAMRIEAAHVAAMAIRFMIDICSHE